MTVRLDVNLDGVFNATDDFDSGEMRTNVTLMKTGHWWMNHVLFRQPTPLT